MYINKAVRTVVLDVYIAGAPTGFFKRVYMRSGLENDMHTADRK